MRYLVFLVSVLVLGVVLIAPQNAYAQDSISSIDKIPDAFKASVQGIGQKLSDIARNLLLSLLVIELIWSLGKTVMQGADFGSLMGSFIKRILIAGFFLALIDGIPTPSGNVGFGTFIIQSAEALTEQSTGNASLKPSDVFFQMFNAGANIYEQSSGTGIIMAVIVWLILILMGAVIVGLMILTYIEIYVIFTVGILSLGFGAWSTTQQFATNFLFAGVGKIFKLFVMILMATLISVQLNAFGPLEGIEDGIIAIGVSLIFVMIMSTVPGSVEQMISGIPASSGDGAVQSTTTHLPKRGAAKAGTMVGGAAIVGTKVAGRMAATKTAAALRALKSKIGN